MITKSTKNAKGAEQQKKKEEPSQPNKSNKSEKSELEKMLDNTLLQFETPPAPLRIVGLFGDVNEQTCADVVQNLLVLSKQGEKPKGEKDGKYSRLPIEFYLNTHGGSASDMFAIYDMMRSVKKECEIHTVGLGKIMSAGVLILAAGTKGKRRIGANSRVMIHSVLGGSEGPLFNLENEMAEIRSIQEKYTKALIKETHLTPKLMKDLLERHVNIYLTAEEAVKYGIADEVF